MTADSSAHDLSSSEGSEDLGFTLPVPPRASRIRVVAVIAIVVAGGFAIGFRQRSKAHDLVATAAEASSAGSRVTRVQAIKPQMVESTRALALPGTVRALQQTKLYPRVTGYVKRWLVDIGDKVAGGQLLAEIDIPDLEAQIAQARAQAAQAEAAVKQVVAQRNFSRSNSQRYIKLANQQLVSKSQVEQLQAQAQVDEASLAASQANVAAQQANLKRLIETAAFARVVAPFAGTITSRSIERGDLVTEGKTSELYTLVATDPVRVFVEVPQSVAPSVTAGIEVNLAVREFPGRSFVGKVTRAAGALDPSVHTMTTEVQVPNGDGTLLPGMYVQAQLSLPVPHRALEIPATALYSDAQGLRVAVVTAQHQAHFAEVTIERDTGATLQIATGLSGDERVVKIAVPGLAEGDPLEVLESPAAAQPAKTGSAAAK